MTAIARSGIPERGFESSKSIMADFTPGSERRQRWMLYAMYVAAVLCCLGAMIFFLTLNETRDFIGDRGVEYCWMYGRFERYLYISLAETCVNIAVLFCLYRLAQGNYLVVYLVIGAIWLFAERLLSFFDMSYC